MDVHDAIAIAKCYVEDIYKGEQVSNVGLEEVEYSDREGTWKLTVGFARPWNYPRTKAQEVLENLGAITTLKRFYKVITVRDRDGHVVSMKDRPKDELQ